MIRYGAQNPSLIRSRLATTVTYNNTTTIANTALSLPVAACGRYIVEMLLHIDNAVKDIKLDFGGTATVSTFIGQYEQMVAATGAVAGGARVTSAGTDFTGASDGASSVIRFAGAMTISAGGTFVVRGAQTTANASNTSILAGSTLTLVKTAPDTTAPGIPAGLNLAVISSSRIDGSFSASSDDTSVTHYRLRRATNSIFSTDVVDTDLGTSLTFSATGLSSATGYYFKVLAEDTAANQSAYSNAANATTDNGSNPSQLSSLVHWYRAKSIADGSNGNDYAVWEDLEGSADTSSSTPPKYYSNAGQPYLEFDGSNDELIATVSSLSDCTYVLIVEVISATTDYARILEDGTMNVFTVGSVNNFYFHVGGDGAVGTLPSRPTGFMAIYCERSGSSDKLRIDGSETVATGKPTTNTGTTLRIGAYTSAGYNGNIRIKEIIICNDNLSVGDFADLADYINDEHGLTL